MLNRLSSLLALAGIAAAAAYAPPSIPLDDYRAAGAAFGRNGNGSVRVKRAARKARNVRRNRAAHR